MLTKHFFDAIRHFDRLDALSQRKIREIRSALRELGRLGEDDERISLENRAFVLITAIYCDRGRPENIKDWLQKNIESYEQDPDDHIVSFLVSLLKRPEELLNTHGVLFKVNPVLAFLQPRSMKKEDAKGWPGDWTKRLQASFTNIHQQGLFIPGHTLLSFTDEASDVIADRLDVARAMYN
jgi:hypothetical protein